MTTAAAATAAVTPCQTRRTAGRPAPKIMNGHTAPAPKPPRISRPAGPCARHIHSASGPRGGRVVAAVHESRGPCGGIEHRGGWAARAGPLAGRSAHSLARRAGDATDSWQAMPQGRGVLARGGKCGQCAAAGCEVSQPEPCVQRLWCCNSGTIAPLFVPQVMDTRRCCCGAAAPGRVGLRWGGRVACRNGPLWQAPLSGVGRRCAGFVAVWGRARSVREMRQFAAGVTAPRSSGLSLMQRSTGRPRVGAQSSALLAARWCVDLPRARAPRMRTAHAPPPVKRNKRAVALAVARMTCRGI